MTHSSAGKFAFVASFVALGTVAYSWNDTGHKAVGAVASRYLTTQSRAKVEAILQKLPDPSTRKGSVMPPDPFHDLPSGFTVNRTPAYQPTTLQFAATWPDDVRKTWLDRPSWHYKDTPIVAPGYTGATPDDGKALDVIAAMVPVIKDEGQPTSTRAMAIAWLTHVVGDIHQPLHAVTFFDDAHVFADGIGDRGGNRYLLSSPKHFVKSPNLHSFWDGVLGKTNASVSTFLKKNGLSKPTGYAAESPSDLANVAALAKSWADESVQAAKDSVYHLNSSGTPDLDWRASEFSSSSQPNAKSIANDRVLAAGKRLASILNAIFG